MVEILFIAGEPDESAALRMVETGFEIPILEPPAFNEGVLAAEIFEAGVHRVDRENVRLERVRSAEDSTTD